MLERPYSLEFNNITDGYLRKSLKLVNQQETSRCFMTAIEGSSETTREATFNFANFYNGLLPGSRKPTKNFLEWFVGFSEGCGNFIMSSDKIFFSIEETDVKTLYTIKKELGFGKVSVFETSARYIVADKRNIVKLINILNGNLLLNKSNLVISAWILEFNNRFPEEQLRFNLRNVLPNLLDNSWLSGFITVNSQFLTKTQPNVNGAIDFIAIFMLKAEEKLLQAVKRDFNCGTISLYNDQYQFFVDNFIGIKKILSYLDRYKIYHYKRYIVYFKWRKYINAVQILNSGTRKVSIDKLLRLANSINESQVEDIVQL